MTIADLLQSELDQRAWAQADLAGVLKWPVQAVSELMKGKRRIDASMAVDLEALTTRSAEEWLSVQAAQDLDEVRRQSSVSRRLSAITIRAQNESLVPVRELVRRHAITAKDPHGQAEQIRELIGDDLTLGASAKRTANAAPLTRAQRAWIALARRDAHEIKVASFDDGAFAELAADLPHLARTPETFREFPAMFANTGVSLVHVKAFPGGRIDGVSLGLDGHPVIALSGRGKRLDKVLFALLHECAHVARGHWLKAPRVHEGTDEQMVGDHAAERDVNELAASWVFPHGLHAPAGVLTNQIITELAAEHGVARAVVVGHLQHKSVIEWSSTLGRGLPTVEEELQTWH